MATADVVLQRQLLPGPPRGDKKLANKKFNGVSFAGYDLTHVDARCSTFVECDFTGADLSYGNCSGANFWGSNFTDAKLYRTNFADAVLERSIMAPKDCFGMTVTLSCDTVSHMKISEKWLNTWLFMALLMDMDPEKENKLIQVVGPERYQKLRQLFALRQV